MEVREKQEKIESTIDAKRADILEKQALSQDIQAVEAEYVDSATELSNLKIEKKAK